MIHKCASGLSHRMMQSGAAEEKISVTYQSHFEYLIVLLLQFGIAAMVTSLFGALLYMLLFLAGFSMRLVIDGNGMASSVFDAAVTLGIVVAGCGLSLGLEANLQRCLIVLFYIIVLALIHRKEPVVYRNRLIFPATYQKKVKQIGMGLLLLFAVLAVSLPAAYISYLFAFSAGIFAGTAILIVRNNRHDH